MKVLLFSAKAYDEVSFAGANAAFGHELELIEDRLSVHSAALADGFEAVCIFVNDPAPREVLTKLAERGVKYVALRSAGFNNVDLHAAAELGLTVVRVPAYSPNAVAEHTIALVLALNRKIHRAYNRVRDGNFALDGLLGFDLNGRTVGVVGTGRIGTVFGRIMAGFGCELLAYDPYPNDEMRALGAIYVDLARLFSEADIIALHAPLTAETHHVVDRTALDLVKPGVLIVNTSRGGLIDTEAAIEALKDGRIGYLGLDVYEEEDKLFFEDLSEDIIQDDTFARLLTFPNVLITAHQGFFTAEALANIAESTIANITAFEQTGTPLHEVTAAAVS